MSMTKFQDIASPVIKNACANGGPFTAVVEILSADAKAPTLIYRLESVLIDNYQPAGGGDSYELARGNTGRGPLEEFTITFTKWAGRAGRPRW